MNDWVILNTPSIYIPAFLGLLLTLIGKHAGKAGALLCAAAVLFLLAALFFAGLYGASWTEMTLLLLANLAILFAENRKGGQ